MDLQMKQSERIGIALTMSLGVVCVMTISHNGLPDLLITLQSGSHGYYENCTAFSYPQLLQS